MLGVKIPRRGVDTRVAYLKVYVLIPIQFLAEVHIEYKWPPNKETHGS